MHCLFIYKVRGIEKNILYSPYHSSTVAYIKVQVRCLLTLLLHATKRETQTCTQSLSPDYLSTLPNYLRIIHKVAAKILQADWTNDIFHMRQSFANETDYHTW